MSPPKKSSRVQEVYRKFRKQGKSTSVALRLARKFVEIEKLKKKTPFATSEAAPIATHKYSVKTFQKQLSKALSKKLGGRVRASEKEVLFVVQIAQAYLIDVFSFDGGNIHIYQPDFFQRFLDEYLRQRTGPSYGNLRRVDYSKINDIVHSVIRKICKHPIEKRDKLFILRNRDFSTHELRIPRLISEEIFVDRGLIVRALNEGKANDPKTHRQIIGVVVREMVSKLEVDEIIRQGEVTTNRAVEEHIETTFPNFKEKPIEIRKRLRQEARATYRGIIGVRIIQDGIRKRLSEYQRRVREFKAINAPEKMVDPQEKNLFRLSFLNRIFSIPENIRFAQKEIPHLWRK